MDKKVLEKLFEGVDPNLFGEEKKAELSEMINNIVETRVKALTSEMEEKENFFLEESKKIAKEYQIKERKLQKAMEAKEKVLEEEAMNFARAAKESLNTRMSIMMEEVENFKKMTEGVVAEEASLYRNKVEEMVAEEAKLYREHLESVALEEAAEFKRVQESALAEEVGGFKKDMVDRISEFFEAELQKSIPEKIMEAECKLAAMEPLVEGVMDVFAKNFIKLDSTSYDVIKEARKENERLAEAVNVKAKDNVGLVNENKKLKKSLKIQDLTSDLTLAQKKKAESLLEGYNLDEIDAKWEQIRDIVITESVKPTEKKTEKLTESKKEAPAPKKSESKPLSEVAKKKIEKLSDSQLNESVDPEMDEYVKRLKKSFTS